MGPPAGADNGLGQRRSALLVNQVVVKGRVKGGHCASARTTLRTANPVVEPVDRGDGQRVVKREHACQWQRHGVSGVGDGIHPGLPLAGANEWGLDAR
jgi:hypothetical protein